jgi:hypothetical protein
MEKGRFSLWIVLSLTILCSGGPFCGCAHTHNIDSAFSWPKAQATMPQLQGREVRVVLGNGNEAEGYVRALEGDTLRVAADMTGVKTAVAYPEIEKITVFNDDNTLATIVGGIVGGAVGAKIFHDNNPEGAGGWGDLSVPATVLGGVVGALAGSVTVSVFFPVRDTYVFRTSPSETLLVRVDKLIEESATGINVRIGGREYLLPKSECTLLRNPGGVYVKGPRAMFTRLGVPVQ